MMEYDKGSEVNTRVEHRQVNQAGACAGTDGPLSGSFKSLDYKMSVTITVLRVTSALPV